MTSEKIRFLHSTVFSFFFFRRSFVISCSFSSDKLHRPNPGFCSLVYDGDGQIFCIGVQIFYLESHDEDSFSVY